MQQFIEVGTTTGNLVLINVFQISFVEAYADHLDIHMASGACISVGEEVSQLYALLTERTV